MPHDKLQDALVAQTQLIRQEGRAKGEEKVIRQVIAPHQGRGPRYLLEGEADREFLRMNSNGYLGMAMRKEVLEAEHAASRTFGVGPGAVRFISGTTTAHVKLERRLARFHHREAAMIFSSAYAAVVGVLAPLVTPETAVISDALNHNSIINAIRLAQPKEKHVYDHLDMDGLETCLIQAAESCNRAIIVTDGVFSMRGDFAPLKEIMEIAQRLDERFSENVVVIADDSHGIGGFGASGRGTEEVTKSPPVDILVATLGKAIGVNGGYVAASGAIIDYLRETSPFYIYSNPITAGEAAAAQAAIDLLDSSLGRALIGNLRSMTERFTQGLADLGLETLPGPHPVVPLMVRDTNRTKALIAHLYDNGILATGLNYPVVPKGDEEIRFQISAEHTADDIDRVLDVLAHFEG